MVNFSFLNILAHDVSEQSKMGNLNRLNTNINVFLSYLPIWPFSDWEPFAKATNKVHLWLSSEKVVTHAKNFQWNSIKYARFAEDVQIVSTRQTTFLIDMETLQTQKKSSRLSHFFYLMQKLIQLNRSMNLFIFVLLWQLESISYCNRLNVLHVLPSWLQFLILFY